MKLSALLEYLQGARLALYSQVYADVQQVISSCCDGKIWISEDSSHALAKLVPESRLCSLPSPIQLLKGIKNSVEIAGMRSCQVIEIVRPATNLFLSLHYRLEILLPYLFLSLHYRLEILLPSVSICAG